MNRDRLLEEMKDELQSFRTEVNGKFELLTFKVELLQRVVYGGVGVILTAILVAVLATVVKQ